MAPAQFIPRSVELPSSRHSNQLPLTHDHLPDFEFTQDEVTGSQTVPHKI